MSLAELEKRSGLKKTLMGAAAIVGGIEAADSIKSAMSKNFDKSKARAAVAYAKSKHPELRRRSEKDLQAWMQGIYAISPRVATSKALAASSLLTIDAYNGNFDLATAKIIADINRGATSDTSSDKAHFMSSLSNASLVG